MRRGSSSLSAPPDDAKVKKQANQHKDLRRDGEYQCEAPSSKVIRAKEHDNRKKRLISGVGNSLENAIFHVTYHLARFS
jgi:hypothetical protein